MGVVIFDPSAFKARYPEFALVNDAALQGCFLEAGLFLKNTDDSPVQDLTRRTLLLNMLTAHIAYVGGLLSVDNMPRPVGRLSQATEGSVSATFDHVQATPGTGAWFQQSQYGAAFWQATTSLRSFKYIPGRTVY